MTYSETAKVLGIKYRVGKYGIRFGRRLAPTGSKSGWELVQMIPLDGWSFDPHEIIESFVNDPAFSVKYKDKK